MMLMLPPLMLLIYQFSPLRRCRATTPLFFRQRHYCHAAIRLISATLFPMLLFADAFRLLAAFAAAARARQSAEVNVGRRGGAG
jgi:hypothetical protein